MAFVRKQTDRVSGLLLVAHQRCDRPLVTLQAREGAFGQKGVVVAPCPSSFVLEVSIFFGVGTPICFGGSKGNQNWAVRFQIPG